MNNTKSIIYALLAAVFYAVSIPFSKILMKIDEIDGIVVGSPVYYGGPNGRITSFLDRLF